MWVCGHRCPCAGCGLDLPPGWSAAGRLREGANLGERWREREENSSGGSFAFELWRGGEVVCVAGNSAVRARGFSFRFLCKMLASGLRPIAEFAREGCSVSWGIRRREVGLKGLFFCQPFDLFALFGRGRSCLWVL